MGPLVHGSKGYLLYHHGLNFIAGGIISVSLITWFQ